MTGRLMRFGCVCALALACSSTLWARGGIGPAPAGEAVRVAYIIPSNRTPQPQGVANLQNAVRWWHRWCVEEMQKYGFTPRGFDYETMPDGVTPRVYVVNVSVTDAVLRQDLWNNTLAAAGNAGVPVWTPGQVWLLVPEMHVENADGSITGSGLALGASFGSGSDPGAAMIGSEMLAFMQPADLTNNTPYHGTIVPAIGPFPLVQDVSFPWYTLSTRSSVSSAFQGAGMHEIGHGFGLAHDFRNDENYHGNIMGNGLRGFRGANHHNLYSQDETRLGFGAALALNASRYFTFGQVSNENALPSVGLTTVGNVTPVNGQVVIAFTASDTTGLAAALLRLNSETIGEIPLSGTSASTSFSTAYYAPGAANQYQISVFDVHGNRHDVNFALAVAAGFNRAPQPFFHVTPSTVEPGASVFLNAISTTDPDHPFNSLTVEWDLDGDGDFDTAPTTTKTLNTSFPSIGARLIGLRVSDPAGAQTLAAPIGVLVRRKGDVTGDGAVDVDDLLAVIAAWGSCPALPALCPADVMPGSFGDGIVNVDDLLAVIANWG